MTNKIRVMLCDDSRTLRRLIKRSIESNPRIEVVAEANHGQEAIDQLEETKPDVVILDVEMPVMDGIDTARIIRKTNKRLPIIMFSTLTSRGAEATFDAMNVGANDFASKPTSFGHVNQALENVQANLVPKIILWADKYRPPKAPQTATNAWSRPKPIKQTQTASPLAQTATVEAETRSGSESISVVGIGVSTGGPAALVALLSSIPAPFHSPILIAQHMPPTFTALLAQRLTQQTPHTVVEAVDGKELRSGDVVIAPGDFHLVVERSGTKVITKLNQDEPENSCRPAVDPLFRSLAKCFGHKSLGIVLTGMGQDGTKGAQAIKTSGGRIIVQDETSSVVWGMPGKVVEAGLADIVLPINQIGQEIAPAHSKPSLSPTLSL